MKIYIKIALTATLGWLLLNGCSSEQANQEVSFKQDVLPILEAECVECHQSAEGEGYEASGLALDNYEGLMEGTNYGPVVIPGEPLNSTLIRLVEGKADPSLQMPHGGIKLTEDKLETLKTWVEQGAKNN